MTDKPKTWGLAAYIVHEGEKETREIRLMGRDGRYFLLSKVTRKLAEGLAA